MKNTFKVESVSVSKDEKKIIYKYVYPPEVGKYFKKEMFFVEYDVSLAQVPKSILIIPLLANIMPVAWFAGFDVEVDELDNVFFEALKNLRTQFTEFFPQIVGKTSEIRVHKPESLPRKENANAAMLFSGGVDAYTTYYRHQDENLTLITIRGVDMGVADVKQWKNLLKYNNNTKAIAKNEKRYITSNLKSFMSFEVEKLVPNLDWWGKVQHGMALTGLSAPLAYKEGYKTLYIASTRTSQEKLKPWGSLPHIDEKMKWTGTKVIHDGYELNRVEKVRTIINNTENTKVKPKLRVCYNEFKDGLNCSVCEKCVRTIFALLINGQDPRLYGFQVNGDIYQVVRARIEKGFAVYGIKISWQQMFDDYDEQKLFIISNRTKEIEEIKLLFTVFERAREFPVGIISKRTRLKQEIIFKYPKLFGLYLKIRRKL